MNKDIAWYVAGPMTGYPQFNYPLFMHVAESLRAQGHRIVSPAEMDSPDVQAAALASSHGSLADLSHLKKDGETYGSFLARDVRIVIEDVGGLVLLPGWERSTGARLESFTGLLMRKEFRGWESERQRTFSLSAGYVLGRLMTSFGELPL